jgi:hypothetical protein
MLSTALDIPVGILLTISGLLYDIHHGDAPWTKCGTAPAIHTAIQLLLFLDKHFAFDVLCNPEATFIAKGEKTVEIRVADIHHWVKRIALAVGEAVATDKSIDFHLQLID